MKKMKWMSFLFSIKAKSVAVALMVLFSVTPNSYATVYDWVMHKVDEDFDKSDNKLGLITKKINYDIGKSEPNYTVDDASGYKILSWVISNQDIPRAKKFLAVIENPNDHRLLDVFSDKSFNLVHLVSFVKGMNEDFRKPIALLDMLSEKNFDFNFSDPYTVPPLVHSKKNVDDKHFEFSQEIRARLLIHGANPNVDGITPDDLSDLVMRAYCQVVKEGWDLKNIKATDYVKELIAEKHKALSQKFSLSM